MTSHSELTCQQVADWLETLAPPGLAEDYDNVGLLVGEASAPVRGILVALDITPAVLAEAVDTGASLIVSHHPIWFRARKSLRGDDFVSQQILYAIRQGLALYACHTNLDSIRDGVNRTIVDRLGLQNVEFLQPHKQSHQHGGHADAFCEAGTGMIGDLPEALPLPQLLERVSELFGTPCIRYAPGPAGQPLQRLAVCGGAGSFLLPVARARGAQAFLTADVTYHHFFDTCDEMAYLDIGHYESEQFCVHVLRDYLAEKLQSQGFVDIDVRATRTNTNPIRYYSKPSAS